MESVLFSWSGGKDSAFALYELGQTQQYHVAALMTTVTQDYDRVSMHGVRRVLLEKQAAALGIPLEKIWLTKNSSNAEYEDKMRAALLKYRDRVQRVVFGDIFLEDLRRYREEKLAQVGMSGIFPIWGRDSKELARTFIAAGFRAIITCVDSQILDQRFVGRYLDEQFLNELPPHVDPCGENGEFHSFAFDGPIFQRPVAFTPGDIVLRDNRFYFCDLIPNE